MSPNTRITHETTAVDHEHATPLEALKCLERYYDEVPRALASVENIGPFTLFVNESGEWPFYARPSLGSVYFVADDVREVLERQALLGVPQTFEWVQELTPQLDGAVAACGLEVIKTPLLRRTTGGQISASVPHGVDIRVIRPHDDLAKIGVVAAAAFGHDAGENDLDAEAYFAESVMGTAALSRQIMEGLVTLVAAFVDGVPVSVAAANPRGALAEIIGMATLPQHRRKGLALAVVAELTRELSRRGVREVFAAAQETHSAEIYAHVGFVQVGTACAAEAYLDEGDSAE